MGYCVNYEIKNGQIDRVNFAPMLSAINAMMTPGGMAHWAARYGDRYSWQDVEVGHQFQDLQSAFEEWGFSTRLMDQGLDTEHLLIRYWEFEKAGEEKKLFQAIAPYLKADFEIEAIGEDGERWRWIVRNGELLEQKAKISYE